MKLVKVLSVLILPFIFVTSVYAADLNVDCPGNSTCNVTGISPLFSVALDGLWYPGKVVTKTISVKNSSSSTRAMAIRGIRNSNLESEFQNMMLYSIIRVSDGSLIGSGTLTDLFGQERVDLGNFNSGENQNFRLIIIMNPAASNNTQNKQIVTDLSLGFWEDSPSLTGSSVSGVSTSSTSNSSSTTSSTVSTDIAEIVHALVATPIVRLLTKAAAQPAALFDILALPLLLNSGIGAVFLVIAGALLTGAVSVGAIFLVGTGAFIIGSFIGTFFPFISRRIRRRD